MPVITIQQTPRSKEEKAELTKRVTEAVNDVYGVNPASVMVFFQEFDDQSWGKNGQLNEDRQKNK
jgi:4-oxalocrotonate tautomerase